MHISATSLAELTEDEFKSAAIQVLSEVLYEKNASFLRNCPKFFFAHFHIFNDLFFIQHNFFASI